LSKLTCGDSRPDRRRSDVATKMSFVHGGAGKSPVSAAGACRPSGISRPALSALSGEREANDTCIGSTFIG
jgi:hypothetical protein